MTRKMKYLINTSNLKHAKKINFIKQHLFYYLTSLVILVFIKLFSEAADADTLRFLLAPVSALTGFICGAPFLWEPHTGYVSHDLHFLIAASCSGISFMMITLGMLLFSFYHRGSSHKLLCTLWLPISLILSYFHTILTNVVRIVLAIYLPIYLEKQGIVPALLSHDTLHTLIGTVIYFSSLLTLSSWMNRSLNKPVYSSFHDSTINIISLYHGHFVPLPVFWYIGFIWALPLFSRLYQRNFTGFGSYTLIVLGSCLIICILYKLFQLKSPCHL